MPGQVSPFGSGNRTAGVTSGCSCYPPDSVDELRATMPERVRGRELVFCLVRTHGGLDLVPCHVLVVDADADHLPVPRVPREEFQPFDLLLHGRHGPCDHIAPKAPSLPGGGMHHEDGRRHRRIDDRPGPAHVRGMGDAPLPLHDDDLRFRLLVCADDLGFELADPAVAFDRIQRYPVRRALDDARLPRRHERRGDPASLRASVSRRAVVLSPIAPSVPRTGIRRQGSLRERSLNCFASRIGRGFRASMRRTPWASASFVNSGSSLRYSCRPATMFRPFSIASRRIGRYSCGMYPPNVATPTITVAGLERSIASFRFATIGMPFGFTSRTSPASRPALVRSMTPTIS